MFTVKTLDGTQELARCATPRETIEKAGALWVTSGGNIKISDEHGLDYSPDEFWSAYEPQKVVVAPRIEKHLTRNQRKKFRKNLLHPIRHFGNYRQVTI